MSTPKKPNPPEELPVRPGTSSDPDDPREIENPGDPGPTVLVPPKREPLGPDQRAPEDCKAGARR